MESQNPGPLQGVARAAMVLLIVLGAVVLVRALQRAPEAPLPPPPEADALPLSGSTALQQVPRGALAGGDVILITMDTTRRDHLGCYGYATARTPVIDALAARSVVFDHAVTGVPSTLPAHASMLTGLDVPRHGVRTNGKYVLGQDHVTLTEVLSEHGYASAAFVATRVLDRRYGLAQGFDHYDDVFEKKRPAAHITDAAVGWLRGQRGAHPDQPVFMWVHYFDPHKPYDPPPEFAAMFPDSLYDGEIAYVDQDMQRLLDVLGEFGVIDDGLIILTADHGEGLGEHLEPTHSRLVYDTTMRVPLLFTLPERFAAVARVDDITVGTIDIMPTVLSLLGIDGPPMDGLDLRTAEVPRARLMYLETLAPLAYHGWSSVHALRGIDRKFILVPQPEYYDLARDPNELHNLLEEDTAAAGELPIALGKRMQAWPTPDDAFRAAARLDQETARRLAALGYISTMEDGRTAPRSRLDPKDAMPVFDVLKTKSPGKMVAAAAELLAVPPVDGRAYRRALLLANEAIALQPDLSYFRLVQGMALYRNGRSTEALEVLPGVGPDERVLGQIFIAMCLHDQQRDAYARQILGEIRDQIDDDEQPLFDEAWGLVRE